MMHRTYSSRLPVAYALGITFFQFAFHFSQVQSVGLTFDTCRVAANCQSPRDCLSVSSSRPCNDSDLFCVCIPPTFQNCTSSSDCPVAERCATTSDEQGFCVSCDTAIPIVALDDGESCSIMPTKTPDVLSTPLMEVTPTVAFSDMPMVTPTPEIMPSGDDELNFSPEPHTSSEVSESEIPGPLTSSDPTPTVSNEELFSLEPIPSSSIENSVEPSLNPSPTSESEVFPSISMPAETPVLTETPFMEDMTPSPLDLTTFTPAVTFTPESSTTPDDDLLATDEPLGPTVLPTPLISALPPIIGVPFPSSEPSEEPSAEPSNEISIEPLASPSTDLTTTAPSLEPAESIEAIVSPSVPDESDNSSPSLESEICFDAQALSHLPVSELVYPTARRASVLCDINGSCATPGHIVVYNGTPMAMSTYCATRSTHEVCTRKVMDVNSPRWKPSLRISSKTKGLQFSAHAARFESPLEEKLLVRLVNFGL